MNGPLLPQCTYSKIMLTVIAVLLAWIAFFRDPIGPVHAQAPAGLYHAVSMDPASWDDRQKPFESFEQKLNAASGGDEIVAVVPYGHDNQFVWVIFRDRK